MEIKVLSNRYTSQKKKKANKFCSYHMHSRKMSGSNSCPILYLLTVSLSSLISKKGSQRKIDGHQVFLDSLTVSLMNTSNITGETLVLYLTTTVSMC